MKPESALPFLALGLAALAATAAEPAAAPRFDPIPERFDRPAVEHFAPRTAPVPARYDRPASERFAPRTARNYEPGLGEGTLPVVLALWPGVQFGYEQDDVSLLRFGLLGSRNHTVALLDFNLFYGRATGAERALQFGAVNVADGPLAGVQFGLLNVSGILEGSKSSGLQIGFLGNYSESLAGGQAGFLMNRAQSGAGVQLAAVCNFADRFRGVQAAVVNLDGDEIRGVQLGVANAGAKDFAGIQLGLVNAGGPRFRGAQVAAVNTLGALDGGFQLGAVNLAGDVAGWQIGVYNSAATLRGVQIGLLNVVESADLPVLPLRRVSF